LMMHSARDSGIFLSGFDAVAGDQDLIRVLGKHDAANAWRESILKYSWSCRNNFIVGICFKQWMRLVWKFKHCIDWKEYSFRVGFVSCLSIINSCLSTIEFIIFGNKIRQTIQEVSRNSDKEHPVFILGHPRSGTTLLHNLISFDSDQFYICNTFCAGFPSSFLWFESIGKVLLSRLIDTKRPMDNMKLSFELPQEDEIATSVMSGGISPYFCLPFMRNHEDFHDFFSFNSSTTSKESRETWTQSFLELYSKLKLRSQRNASAQTSCLPGSNEKKRALLKSPVHTSRIQLLLQMFPNAQFIYIHRNPYEVYASAKHMAVTTYPYVYLSVPTEETVDEFIFKQYEILWNDYFRDREMILSSNKRALIEISYSELCHDPMSSISKIYEYFGWNPWSPEFRTKLEDIVCTELRSYKKNEFQTHPREISDEISRRWNDSILQLGYEFCS